MVLVEYGELEDREEEVDVAPPLAADILQAEAPSQHVARADRAGGLEGSTFDSGKWWSERWTDEARKAKSDNMKKYWEDNQDRREAMSAAMQSMTAEERTERYGAQNVGNGYAVGRTKVGGGAAGANKGHEAGSKRTVEQKSRHSEAMKEWHKNR